MIQHQTIEHKAIYEDGTLIPFFEDLEIVKTTVRVIHGRNNFDGKPKQQLGFVFTHVVERKNCSPEDTLDGSISASEESSP